MTINTTIGALVDAAPALRKLAVQDLPVKTAYRLTRMIRKTDDHMAFYEERHSALLRKHCEQRPGEDASHWYPKSAEDRAAFEAGLTELRGVDVELEGMGVCVIMDADSLRISCADMIALDGLVKFELNTEGEEDEQ